MEKMTMRKTQWLLLLVIFGIFGCSGWKITERGGKDRPCFTNGACDTGLTCVARTCQAKTPGCEANAVSCDKSWTRSCQDGAWVRISDCTILDQVCEKGVCVKTNTDGDEENEDLDTEDGTKDGDIESEQELDSDTDNMELGDEELDIDRNLSCAKGVCTDRLTSFEWQQSPTGGTMIWDNASTHCQALDLDGKNWRLPNISELRSLVRNCKPIETQGSCGVTDVCSSCGTTSACLTSDSSCFTLANCYPSGCTSDGGPTGCYWPTQLQGACSWYWSASGRSNETNSAWFILFSNGYIDNEIKTTAGLVRCIRGGSKSEE